MNKHALVELTLEQLLDAFRTSPESFEYEDSTYTPHKLAGDPAILWQPKCELKDHTIVADPINDQKAVIVVYNEALSEITCYIFSKAIVSINLAAGSMADATVTSKHTWFTIWRGNYRKFDKLRNLIKARDRNKENDRFLRKLNSVFPSALDKHILS